jgi:ribosomal protein S27E
MIDEHPLRGYAWVITWGIECPWCKSPVEYDHDPTGTTVRCNVCGDPITILRQPMGAEQFKKEYTCEPIGPVETIKCPDADINIGGQP